MIIESKYKIRNKTGLHARPASLFVQIANKFKSDIVISKDGKTENAKSMLGLLSLGINKDSEISITFDGIDAEEASMEIKSFINSLES